MEDRGRDADLAREMHERQQRAEHELASTSSLPKSVFDACDPIVEAVLADAALKVFRRHMVGEEHAVPQQLPPGEIVEEVIPIAEMQQCASALAEIGAVDPPAFDDGLRAERMWILLDMSKHGAGIARQRATHELRDLLASTRCVEELGAGVLSVLVPLLAEVKSRKGMPVIFHALHLAAERALRTSIEARA